MSLDSKELSFKCPGCGCEERLTERSEISTATRKFLGLENRKAQQNPKACNGCGHIVWQAGESCEIERLEVKTS